MADDTRPDDDATRIYRPYGSPPPEAGDAPDPFAPDPPEARSPQSGPFDDDPFAPGPDPFAPSLEPDRPDTPDPLAPPPSVPDVPEARRSAPDPFAPDAFDRDPFGPLTPGRPAAPPDPFAPSSASTPGPGDAPDPFGVGASHAPDTDDPFRTPAPGLDPFAPPAPSAPEPPAAPASPFDDPFRSSSTPDPFEPSPPSTPDPFAAPPPSAPEPDPFSVSSDDPFAPPPPVREGPRDRAPDPFSAPPVTGSDDPFAALQGPSLAGSGGRAFDSGLRSGPDPEASVELPDVFGTEQTLAGAFTPVFSLILQIRASEFLGDPTSLRQRIEALLAESARAARAAGASDADVAEATFCLVAFLDEAILGTDWPGHDAWSAQPLQLTHYDRYDAGERFFDRLKGVLDEGGTRTAVLEVYYLCLALGFKGRYAIHGREVLRRLVDDLHVRLERANGAPGALSPRGRSREVPAEAEKGGIPTWALWAGAAVLVALLYLGLSLSLSGVANETADDLRAISAPGIAE